MGGRASLLVLSLPEGPGLQGCPLLSNVNTYP